MTTTTQKTLDVLCSMFARYGLPEQHVSSTGPQFISSDSERFMKKNRIRTSLYHPASNGEAERFIQVSNIICHKWFRINEYKIVYNPNHI